MKKMKKRARYLDLVDVLAAAGKQTFTTKDVLELESLSPQAASNLLTRMEGYGLIDRVARGRFALRPIGALGTRAASEDIALAVGAAFGGRRHRIGYQSALDHHGLLRHPTRKIIVATDTRTTLPTISGRPLRLVIEKPERLDVGSIDAGHGARVSSIERALLESAARPELSGGIEVVASALVGAKIDTDVLQDLARQLDARTALNRLGSLAEALEVESLASKIEPMSAWGRLIELDPELGGEASSDEGAWRHHKWGVEWPFSIEELEETVRR